MRHSHWRLLNRFYFRLCNFKDSISSSPCGVHKLNIDLNIGIENSVNTWVSAVWYSHQWLQLHSVCAQQGAETIPFPHPACASRLCCFCIHTLCMHLCTHSCLHIRTHAQVLWMWSLLWKPCSLHVIISRNKQPCFQILHSNKFPFTIKHFSTTEAKGWKSPKNVVTGFSLRCTIFEMYAHSCPKVCYE